ASENRLGKSLGDDFREGKMTLPVLRALARADAEERAFWQRCLGDAEQGEGDFDRARAILDRHGALEDSLAAARGHAQAGREALMALPDHPIRGELANLIGFAVERDH